LTFRAPFSPPFHSNTLWHKLAENKIEISKNNRDNDYHDIAERFFAERHAEASSHSTTGLQSYPPQRLSLKALQK
jgi:hypothetical protein